jgi:hypothetical protein
MHSGRQALMEGRWDGRRQAYIGGGRQEGTVDQHRGSQEGTVGK